MPAIATYPPIHLYPSETMTTAKSSGSIGDTSKNGPTDSHKVVDSDSRKVVGTIATPRNVRAD